MPRKKAVPEEEQSIVQETVTAAPANVEQTEVHEESPLRQFFSLNFNELDRDLKEDERAEWNAIYASFRSKSALSGKIIGVDRFTNDMGNGNIQDVYCAIVIPYRVRIVIPAGEMWMDNAPPDFVFRGMVGAKIEFVITRVEREAGFAMASRREAMRNRRYYFSHRRELS